MRSTSGGDGLIERSGMSLRPASERKRVSSPGSATPWVLLVFALAGGGFAAYDFWGRARIARASTERATSELALTRQRAFDAETKEGHAAGTIAVLKAENEQLRGELDALAGEQKKATVRADTRADTLATELARTFAAGEGELTTTSAKLTLDLLDKVLFRTAKAELTPAGKKVLRRVGDALNKHPDRAIWVIGHTDDAPSKGGGNWELSTARALSVVHFLIDEVKVDPRRLAAAGMGSYRPVSRSSKARNRRIELVIFPRDVKVQKP